MFFVTLLLSAAEAWMRGLRGSTSLRALVYFDEIFGYLPPIAQPPSKPVLLRLLKQARAFGLGVLLATQNPADVDYKGLSNAGTWFIGKLATERDKERLLDGLASSSPEALDRREYDQLISGLGKRVFLLRNVHESRPVLFQTRWAMNYLAGPVTRAQIDELNILAGAISLLPADEGVPEEGDLPAVSEEPEVAPIVNAPLAATVVAPEPPASERRVEKPTLPPPLFIDSVSGAKHLSPGAVRQLARCRPAIPSGVAGAGANRLLQPQVCAGFDSPVDGAGLRNSHDPESGMGKLRCRGD
jgi:hypothetical protein